MNVLAALLLCLSPVPKGPPPPDPIVPGYRWMFSGYVLEVVAVDGNRVTYRCCNIPRQSWGACDGYANRNEQSKERVKREEYDHRGTEPFPVVPDI